MKEEKTVTVAGLQINWKTR